MWIFFFQRTLVQVPDGESQERDWIEHFIRLQRELKSLIEDRIWPRADQGRFRFVVPRDSYAVDWCEYSVCGLYIEVYNGLTRD
jgi:hypothetical protein